MGTKREKEKYQTECDECCKHLFIEYKCKQCGKRFCSLRCRNYHKCPRELHSQRHKKDKQNETE